MKTEREQEIDYYMENDVCPICKSDVEIDNSKSNERDSSNDIHRCPKCGWYCCEMETWDF